MAVVHLRGSATAENPFTNIREDEGTELLPPNGQHERTGEPYARLIRRYGIANFVFSYGTGTFSALDGAGREIARGETIKELLDSL